MWSGWGPAVQVSHNSGVSGGWPPPLTPVVGHKPAVTEMKEPRYRRVTITEAATGEGKFSRPGNYGHVVVKIEPTARGKGVEILSEIAGAALPEGYVKSASDGVREALLEGAVPGCQVVDVIVRVVGGSCHPTDSSELAFKLAGIFAIKHALKSTDLAAIE